MGKNFILKMFTMDGKTRENYENVNVTQVWKKWVPSKLDGVVTHGPQTDRIRIVDDGLAGEPPDSAKLKFKRDKYFFQTKNSGKEDADLIRQVSVFSTIQLTLDMFEHKEALGRAVSWAFSGKTLSVHIRQLSNDGSAYSRGSSSIVFSFFQRRADRLKREVYDCESPDIVAHEAAHAILDGIAPDLYSSTRPQTMALHEAIADLTSLFLTLRMNKLREAIIEKTNGELRQPNALGWIAEEFGSLHADNKNHHYLRSLFNTKKLSQYDQGGELEGELDNHHLLSEVFSGAVYDALMDEYDYEAKFSDKPKSYEYALRTAAFKIRRMLYRALDYLPPSDVLSFYDVARAVVLVDMQAYPEPKDERVRNHFIKAFRNRDIFDDDDVVSAPILEEDLALIANNLDVSELASNNVKLKAFVDARRGAFHIPEGVSIEVSALQVEQSLHQGKNTYKKMKSLILKAQWSGSVSVEDEYGHVTPYRIFHGSTMAIDVESKKIRFVISSRPLLSSSVFEKQHYESGSIAQGRYLNKQISRGVIVDANDMEEADRKALKSPYWIRNDDDIVLVENAQSQLHVHNH